LVVTDAQRAARKRLAILSRSMLGFAVVAAALCLAVPYPLYLALAVSIPIAAAALLLRLFWRLVDRRYPEATA
jgi:hypothetical protein